MDEVTQLIYRRAVEIRDQKRQNDNESRAKSVKALTDFVMDRLFRTVNLWNGDGYITRVVVDAGYELRQEVIDAVQGRLGEKFVVKNGAEVNWNLSGDVVIYLAEDH